jgi:hypothetical protein
MAQQTTTTLSGQVTDAATGKPMPFVNVYLNSSTRGTTTNESGHFILTGVPLGSVEVVVSFVGYQTERRTLRLDDTRPRPLNVNLKPGDQTLATVTVRGNPKKWQQQLRQFKRLLLGEPFGGQCLILNEDVLHFTEDNGHLKATATEPILIENQALGYRLWYDMDYFDGTFQKTFYAGTARFEALKPADERQARRFSRNRMRAYLGSTRHLMASLIDSTYEQEGFLVYQEDLTRPKSIDKTMPTLAAAIEKHKRLIPFRVSDLIKPGKLSFERQLISNRQLVVFYTPVSSSYSPYSDARYAYSQITLPQGSIQLTVDGTITMPKGMEVQGSLADDRLSTMLPADWQPAKEELSNTTPTVVQQGKLLPPDQRLGRITTAFTGRFQHLAPVLFTQIDKPFYATGDRLWLSTYLLDAATNRLPIGETALHTDLLTANGQLVQHQWLKVTDGRAVGNFRLSDSLASGVYRLRTYTDEDDAQHRPAFERSIAVYNLVESAQPPTKDTTYKSLDIQGLPEGGRWVAGLPARLGLKLVGPDGRGVRASGRITDEAGTEIASFVSSSLGMGSVSLTPQTNRQYYAEVIHQGHRQRVPLPAVDADGYTLSADMVSDTNQLLLTVMSNNRLSLDSVYVLCQHQGRLVDQRKIQLQNGLARIQLPVSTWPPGLIQLTLYDATAHPRAERLLFVPERLVPVRVLLATNKTRFKPREQVLLRINLNDDGQPAVAALSASVTDAEQVPNDSVEATIQTHLLLTGELRGRVENPNAYFQTAAPEIRRALDDLLLTQGWRRVSGTPDAELLGGVSVIGRVLNAKNEPIPNAQVTLASTAQNQSFVRSAGANERGRFRLAGLAISDTARLLVQLSDRQLKAFPPKDAHLVQERPGITWESGKIDSLPNWAAWRTEIEAARVRQETNAELYRDKKVKILKEVTVRARKYDERPDDIRRRSLHNAADATLVFDDTSPRFANLYEMIRGRVPGVSVTQTADPGKAVGMSYNVVIRGVGSLKSGTQPLYLMDGMPIQDADGTGLLAFNPGEIERIEVLKNGGSTGIYGVRGGNGVIAFYSKTARPEQSSASSKTGMTTMQLIGYPAVQRDFYVPRYDADSTDPKATEDSIRVDRRDVLYWKPIIQTDSQGRATIGFPLSDVVRTIRVRIQGITAEGRPVVSTSLIRVQ